ncbi:hypothetical protein U9M48_041575 [Paspalum notatum var. saurae]|uniref:Embryo defective 2735 n=1 Tax=Paspalum notatum var. saurae TaxID=547442 RepID=A0AAQ3UP23_PASNO
MLAPTTSSPAARAPRRREATAGDAATAGGTAAARDTASEARRLWADGTACGGSGGCLAQRRRSGAGLEPFLLKTSAGAQKQLKTFTLLLLPLQERLRNRFYSGFTAGAHESIQQAAVGVSKRSAMKFRVVCRKLYDYVRYDLKEIAFPSSLPDPPHIKKRPKLSWHDRWCILKEATRLYTASWVRDIGPDLRPNDYKKVAEDEESPGSNGSGSKKGAASGEPSVLEDLAVAARGGAETLKPALRRIYMARASTYTDAMKNFVDTYQEGLKDQLQEKAGGGGEGAADGGQQQQKEGDDATKPPPP